MSKKTKEKAVELVLPVLAYGSKGDAVKAVQSLLQGYGYKVGITGSFGEGTRTVLQKAQKAWGLPETGKTDEETWKALLGIR